MVGYLDRPTEVTLNVNSPAVGVHYQGERGGGLRVQELVGVYHAVVVCLNRNFVKRICDKL